MIACSSCDDRCSPDVFLFTLLDESTQTTSATATSRKAQAAHPRSSSPPLPTLTRTSNMSVQTSLHEITQACRPSQL
eukprot:1491084-Amphidinium_carterae.1